MVTVFRRCVTHLSLYLEISPSSRALPAESSNSSMSSSLVALPLAGPSPTFSTVSEDSADPERLYTKSHCQGIPCYLKASNTATDYPVVTADTLLPQEPPKFVCTTGMGRSDIKDVTAALGWNVDLQLWRPTGTVSGRDSRCTNSTRSRA